MAVSGENLESLLSRARNQEKEYDWPGAAQTYGNALSMIPESNPEKIGETLEQKAYANYKAALQAAGIDEFSRMADTTAGQYAIAKEAYEKAGGPESKARMDRCDGMLAFLGFIRANDAAERKRQADDSWERGMKSLDGFAAAGNGLEFCKTFNELCPSAAFASSLVRDFESRKKRMTEGLRYGEKAVAFTINFNDPSVAVRTLVLASSFWERVSYSSMGGEDPQTCHRKAVDCWQKAESLSKETVLEAIPLAWMIGDAPFDANRNADNEMRAFVNSIEVVRKSVDRFLIGYALAGLSFYAFWLCFEPEDKERSDSLLRQALDYAIEARNEFSKIGFMAATHANIWVMSPFAEYYSFSAFFENDLKKKREHAQKALEAWPEHDKLAKLSGYTWFMLGADQVLGNAYFGLAKAEVDIDQKRALFEKAVHYWKKAIDVLEIWDAGTLYNLGSNHMGLAEVQAEFAEAMADCDNKARALREAIELGEKAIVEFTSGMATSSMTEDAGSHANLGWSWSRLGKRYSTLFEIVRDGKLLSHSSECFESSADEYLKAGQLARAAENLWEAARVCDSMGDHSKSSELFMRASKGYTKAVEGIPQLKEIYSDHSVYMNAWSEIEKARYYHAGQEPASAKEHYNKAGELHESTGKWSFLSTNYFAWAQVENAEDLSQRERCRESVDAFREAARLFKDSKKKLQEQLAKIEVNDEKQMVERLIDAAGSRQELCEARIALEEARLLDKEGNTGRASEKYGLVADMFAKIMQGLVTEQDRKEIELIIILSKAWKAMAKAEAESSPESYEEAAHLFDEAKNLSPGDKAKNLAMGHSRFCRALQAGVRFSDTGDLAQHDIATNDLESASKFYLKAGLKSASEYARASKLLFDAYVQTNKATNEEDHEKKAKLYSLTEKILQASASSYEKADQPGKKDQVLNLLARVQQDRELAVSLAEVFHAPDAVSTTMAFSSPTPTHETAAGLDRFEHADIQATMVARPKDLLVGEDFNLEIELVNAGRGAAQLTKVEEVIPHGFDVKEVSEKYRIEDSYLNLRGRRLDALRTEDVKVVLKPTVQGRFRLNPRIMYLDESGKYKSYEPEPVDITVKELGISGWLKGSEKKR